MKALQLVLVGNGAHFVTINSPSSRAKVSSSHHRRRAFGECNSDYLLLRSRECSLSVGRKFYSFSVSPFKNLAETIKKENETSKTFQ